MPKAKTITLYTVTADDTVEVSTPAGLAALGVTAAQLAEAAGPAFRTETITLKPNITQSNMEHIDAAIKRINPETGMMVFDEPRRAGVTIEELVDSWTFMDGDRHVPTTADGFAELDPDVAVAVFHLIMAKVKPSLAGNPATFTLASAIREKLRLPS